MFTGIIQEIGIATYFSRYQKSQNLKVRTKTISSDAKIGDSISVNGVCLTITNIKSDILSFDLVPETIELTNLGLLKVGDCLNLEESLKANDKISGHFVTGHIDCKGIIKKKGIIKNNHFFEISVPGKFMNLLTPKGSVAIDGISLTVVNVFRDSFTVYIIPHTLNNTIIGKKGVAKEVNIEFDILAKYALNPVKNKIELFRSK
ncbi:MAG: riboflavin synthase [Candidatus Omnitrophica bacterium]|nr:riboflavin synthase [Candidatus Omnitrophota bacterium]